MCYMEEKEVLKGQLCMFHDECADGDVICDISELECGEYYAFHYDDIFELYDGRCYKMPYCIECPKNEANLVLYEVYGGDIKPKKELLVGRIQTPDGTVLSSRHRHDFVEHYDSLSKESYFVDGGGDYLRMSVNKIPAKNISVYTTSDFETIRQNVCRGTFDIYGNGIYKPISKCSDEHLRCILVYNEEHGFNDKVYNWIIKRELEYRKENHFSIQDDVIKDKNGNLLFVGDKVMHDNGCAYEVCYDKDSQGHKWYGKVVSGSGYLGYKTEVALVPKDIVRI